MSKVLVIAVHPDDETLACGGTLLKHKANGDSIHWVIVTEMKEVFGFSKEVILKRDQEISTVSSMYNFDEVYRLGFPTTQLDSIKKTDLIMNFSEILNKVQPEIIYLPFKEDVHSDHRIAFEAVYSCTKVFRHQYIKKILMMETVSETDYAPSIPGTSFVPNFFVDISDFFLIKLEILKVFESELGQVPFPRSIENIEALCKYRGSISGCKYAESFMLLKEIW